MACFTNFKILDCDSDTNTKLIIYYMKMILFQRSSLFPIPIKIGMAYGTSSQRRQTSGNYNLLFLKLYMVYNANTSND